MKKREFIMPTLPSESFKMVKESLKNQLIHAKENNELIDVRGVRFLGKSDALIEFARENGYIAIVNESVFNKFKDNCITKRHLKHEDCSNLEFVIDEGIDIYSEELKGKNIKIATGYYSDFDDINIQSKNNLNEITSNNIMYVLKEDLNDLMKKRSECVRGINKRNDASKTALECTRLIKDSLELINKYDWQLMCSEYHTDGKKQVAVWEQNGEGTIRNHKVWDVSEYDISHISKMGIELNSNTTFKDFIKELSKHWRSMNDFDKKEIAEFIADKQ